MLGGGVTFDASQAVHGLPLVSIPCGQCIGCRIKKRQSWTLRCLHEAVLHKDSCFVTLTYDNKHLPADGSLNKKHWQDFAKRVRKHVGPFRYLHCGEYGSRTFRPHYHALMFGCSFMGDALRVETGGSTYPLFNSGVLDGLWGHGLTVFGAIERRSAQYVASYTVKKLTGDQAAEQYRRLDPFTGEETYVAPEYATMSRRPGIGAGWYARWKGDLFPSDECVSDGKRYAVPRYYYDRLKAEDPGLFEKVRAARRARFDDHYEDLTWDRLKVREEIASAKLDLFGSLSAKL